MLPNQKLNCVIIGYNDIDFATSAASQKRTESISGAYQEIKTNSVLLQGKRYTYMEIINQAIARAQGSNPHLNVFEAPSLGSFYLKNFLHNKGLRAEVVNFFNYDKEKLVGLLGERPDAVAITTTFYVDSAPIVEVVKFVRKHCPDTKVIVGGPYALNIALDLDAETLEFVLQEIGADIYVIDSQGESTLAKVVECIRSESMNGLRAIPNLLYTVDGITFTRTPRMPENNELDESTIDWSLFDSHEITPVSYLRTARSCPFACTFCNYPVMAGEHVVSKIENVESQLKYLSSIGTTDIVFIDDTLNVPLTRFKNMLRMVIKNGLKFRWISFFRCSNADEEAIDLMKESGCLAVFLGLESGDQQILKYMNKAATLERYRWGIENLHRRGIATFASLICGFPGETQESVINTLNFIEEMAPTFFNVQLYYHDLRSPIHKKADEFQIQGAGYSWRHRSMDWREAMQWVNYLYKNIHNSNYLPVHGFSLWGVPYLLSRGISFEQIKKFSNIVRPMLLSSLDDVPTDFSNVEAQLTKLFRNTSLLPRSRAL
ncbi:MAG TPA: PhpK family radical SAM P-methyltransferase [Pyrinomonadaceae bacterium]|nr:PhpK family radical SAM P-methyltransferase [Pyrinomonadaceae bacterium]